ncbi:MAG: YceH family protein [Candidatus Cloacimonetes bacterium]|nr:YceH family protein [Candidatus Cloacimonadota bacterium]
MELTGIETRVIGSLIEKELTTPDYYPLSLNALLNACNQKSNRNPVMNLNEQEVLQALSALKEKGLAVFSSGQGQRITKYRHYADHYFSLDHRELSLLAVLFLRGAQTLGELRLRTQRMYDFSSLEEVQDYLTKLSEREEPLVKLLPRQPGQKEQRYIHLLNVDYYEDKTVEKNSPQMDELIELKETVTILQKELQELREDFYKLKAELE